MSSGQEKTGAAVAVGSWVSRLTLLVPVELPLVLLGSDDEVVVDELTIEEVAADDGPFPRGLFGEATLTPIDDTLEADKPPPSVMLDDVRVIRCYRFDSRAQRESGPCSVRRSSTPVTGT